MHSSSEERQYSGKKGRSRIQERERKAKILTLVKSTRQEEKKSASGGRNGRKRSGPELVSFYKEEALTPSEA